MNHDESPPSRSGRGESVAGVVREAFERTAADAAAVAEEVSNDVSHKDLVS